MRTFARRRIFWRAENSKARIQEMMRKRVSDVLVRWKTVIVSQQQELLAQMAGTAVKVWPMEKVRD